MARITHVEWKRRQKEGIKRARAERKLRPKPGLSLQDLAALPGTTTRTVRYYMERGVIPPPKVRGPGTRYERAHLLRLVAARTLRAFESLGLDAIKKRLADDPRGPRGARRAQATTLGIAVAAPAASARTGGTTPVAVGAEKRWSRLELAVGLELHVRDDASPFVRALAAELWKLCVEGDLGA